MDRALPVLQQPPRDEFCVIFCKKVRRSTINKLIAIDSKRGQERINNTTIL